MFSRGESETRFSPFTWIPLLADLLLIAIGACISWFFARDPIGIPDSGVSQLARPWFDFTWDSLVIFLCVGLLLVAGRDLFRCVFRNPLC
jgi:hypothetical protein